MRYFLIIIVTVVPNFVLSQKMPFKFGDIDKKLLEMNVYPLDSGADAVILADFGTSRFYYDKEYGFYFLFERTTRIKIFNSDGYNYANVEIPIYHSSSGDKESVSKVRGYTYNLDEGNVVKSKLEKDGRFKEEYDQNWTLEKFTMPDVREGSIIEYQYAIRSPFWSNLRTWEFQKEIPVKYSEYYVTIPEYFDYQQLSSGYHPLKVVDERTVSGKISITSVSKATKFSGRSDIQNSTIDFTQTEYHRLAEDVPAFKKEGYMNAVSNYLTKIEFELRGTRFPNQPYESRIGTWPSLNKTFLEADNFGMALKHDAFLKEVLESFPLMDSNDKIVAAVVALIQKEIEWNGSFRFVTSSSLNEVWKDKKGSSAEINLILVAALRRLSIDSDPVLISTRSHGLIREHFAVSSQFNSVIAVARFDDKIVLLDATDKYLPVGVLPEACINEKGFIISESNSGWVDIYPSTKAESLTTVKLEMNESGELVGSYASRLKGYQSYGTWKKYLLEGEEDFVKEVKTSHKSWKIKESSFPEKIDIHDPFQHEHKISLEGASESAGNLIFINPMLSAGIDENPFKLEDRKYPVDFIYPRSSMYMFSLTLPEGFVIDEIPESQAVALPNKGGLFQYNVMAVGNSISIVSKYTIENAMFLPEEYAALKEFFSFIVNKHDEQIVIKRKT